MATSAAVRRPSLESKRSSSSTNLGANEDDTSSTAGQARHHKHKQFVVHRDRYHTRVPSFGKNLNKLAKLTTATDPSKPHKHAHPSPSPGSKSAIKRRSSSEKYQVAEDRQPSSTKRATFELGDSDDEGQDSHENGTNQPKETRSIVKSSSIRSLDRQSGEAATAKKEDSPKKQEQSSDSSREKDRHTNRSTQQQQQQQQQQPPEAMASVRFSQADTLVGTNSSRLLRQGTNATAVSPKVNAECVNGLHTPVSANPGSSSFPNNNQALTSRFLDSPGRSGASISPGRSSAGTNLNGNRPPSPPSSGPDKPPSQAHSPPAASSSATTAVPSRTQQKLWLQRASSQFDGEHQLPAKKVAPGGEWTGFSPKEVERTAREFYNVRRFRDPVGEGLDRIRDHPTMQQRIPRKGTNSAAQEAGMGLSQSLNAGFGRTIRNPDKGPKGSRDDSGLKSQASQRDPNIQALLQSMWDQQPLTTGNE